MAAGSSPPLLEIVGATKRYDRLVACGDVSLRVEAGEVVGLLGQNGAGKSTLMKVIGGVVNPTSGIVRVAGQRLPPGDPIAAAKAGIGIVHQHFSLVEALSVWENVTLGEQGAVREQRSIDQVTDIGRRYGLEVDPRARVDDLSPGERQRVEIIKCLRKDPRVIMLDEPTSALTQQESHALFGVLRALVRQEHRAIVLVSHRLEEIMRATDRVVVMRDGRVSFEGPTAQSTAEGLAREMVGREVVLSREGAALGIADTGPRVGGMAHSRNDGDAGSRDGGSIALELRDVVVVAEDGQRQLDGMSLHVERGEILGIAGVEGNGQRCLQDVLSGLVPLDSGSVSIGGQLCTGRRGELSSVGVIPSDRHDSGCVLEMSLMENLVLGQLDRVTTLGTLRPRRMAARAHDLVAQYEIVASGPDAPMWTLSGGNQQRSILARELSRKPSILVAAQPTRGLDVGAMEDLWRRLRRAATDGTAVLLVSTELDEILALSDRVAVIQRGRIAGQMRRDEIDPERLGLLIGGRVA